MKKFDIVKLKNDVKYRKNGLKNGFYGVIIDIFPNFFDILFFNDKNQGECIFVSVAKTDVEPDKYQLPKSVEEMLSKNIQKIRELPKNFKPLEIKEYDLVELINDKEEYAKQGIAKGQRGCAMSEYATMDEVLVDFSGIDKDGNFYGDCILVNVNDLKIINN